MPSNIYLIRHAEPENAVGRGLGHTDAPLTARGIEAAARLAGEWRGRAQIQSSDLVRAVGTAAAFGAPFTVDPRWREMHFGIWDGQRFDDIAATDGARWQRFLDDFDTERAPGGECFLDLQTRAVSALDALPDQDHLIVCHAGVIRALLCHALELPARHGFRFRIDYTSVTLLQRTQGRIDVCYVNADRFLR
jgi:broad specificity phosphatase PhoE